MSSSLDAWRFVILALSLRRPEYKIRELIKISRFFPRRAIDETAPSVSRLTKREWRIYRTDRTLKSKSEIVDNDINFTIF